MIILCKYTIIFLKPIKMHDIPHLSYEFSDSMHSTPGKIRKLSSPIGSKKLPWTLRNWSELHKISKFFRNRVYFIQAKISRETENFSGREFTNLSILFDGISKFWMWNLPSHPEIQALSTFSAIKCTTINTEW